MAISPAHLRLPALGLLALALLPFAGTASAAAPPAVPGEVIVRYERDTAGRERADVRSDADAELAETLALPRTQLLEVDSTRQAVARLERDPRVEFAEPNFLVSSFGAPSDSGFPFLWGLHNTGQGVLGGPASADADTDWLEAWEAGVTRAGGVTVAVVDTGVAADHPDLAGKIAPGGFDWIENDSDASDLDGHGTHVAGTIAARENGGGPVVGMATGASILPMRVLASDGWGTTADIASAFSAAGDRGAQVVNASLGGGGYSDALRTAIVSHPATLYVVAAGNEGLDVDTPDNARYPCAYDAANLVCVAAGDQGDRRASFSNYGAASVDLAAPGTEVLSSYPTFATVASPAPARLSSGSVLRGPFSLAGQSNCKLQGDLDFTAGGARLHVEGSADGVAWSALASFGDDWLDGFGAELRYAGRFDFHGGPLHLRLRLSGAGGSTYAYASNMAIRCLTATGTAAYLSGTSMAAPHVAGAAAVLFAAPGATAAGVRARLLGTGDASNCFTAITTTGTRLNLARAAGLTAGLGTGPSSPACAPSAAPDATAPAPGVTPTGPATPGPTPTAAVTTTPPGGATEAPSRPRVDARSTLSGRIATVKLACPDGGARCTGAFVLESGRAKLTTRRFDLAAGRVERRRIRLSRTALRKLTRKSRARIRARVL